MLIKNANKIVLKLGSSTVIDSKGIFKKKWVTSLIKDINIPINNCCVCYLLKNNNIIIISFFFQRSKFKLFI